jgi:hypothetical protein
MKLTLKIACGVFLGILAAAGVYEAINIWEVQQRARMYAAQQKQEAELLKARMDRAESRLFKLSPNQALELCGLPLHETKRAAGAFRTMTYLGADSHEVTLNFQCGDDWCLLMGGMTREHDQYDLEAFAYEQYMGSDHKYHPSDAAAELKELPCLVGP